MRDHVKGSSSALRVHFAGLAILFLVIGWILLEQNDYSLENWSSGSAGELFGLWFIPIAVTLLFLRMPFLGMWIDGDNLIIGSWWRTYRLERSGIANCRSEKYRGILSYVTGPILRTLVIDQAGSDLPRAARSLPGVAAFPRASKRVSERIRTWLRDSP